LAATDLYVGDDRACLETRSSRQPFFERLQKGAPHFRCRILSRRQVEAHRQQRSGVDAEIHRVEREEASHHQAGPGEQHQRQRQLDDDQCAGPAARPDAARIAAPTFFQDVIQIGFRDVKRRRQAEYDPGG